MKHLISELQSGLKQLWERFLTFQRAKLLVFCILQVKVLQLSLVMTWRRLLQRQKKFQTGRKVGHNNLPSTARPNDDQDPPQAVLYSNEQEDILSPHMKIFAKAFLYAEYSRKKYCIFKILKKKKKTSGMECPLGGFPWSLPWGDHPQDRLGKAR